MMIFMICNRLLDDTNPDPILPKLSVELKCPQLGHIHISHHDVGLLSLLPHDGQGWSLFLCLKTRSGISVQVVAGLECGVGVDGFSEWQVGDSIQAFRMVGKKRTLEDASVTVRAAVAAITNNGGSS